MIKALRAAASKVPFQKDKMASPSRLCVTPSVCGEGGVAGATPWTESSCFIMFPGFYLDTIIVLQDKSGLTMCVFLFFFLNPDSFSLLLGRNCWTWGLSGSCMMWLTRTQWADVSAPSQTQDLLNDFLVMDEHSSSLHSDSCLTCTCCFVLCVSFLGCFVTFELLIFFFFFSYVQNHLFTTSEFLCASHFSAVEIVQYNL